MYGHKTHGYNGDLFSMSQRTAQVANKAVTMKADQATAPRPITPIDHNLNVTDDQWGAIIVDAGQTILEETLAGNTLRLQDIKAILPTENTADWSNTCNAIEAAVIAWIRTHLDITVEPQEVIRAITDFAKRLPTHTIADELKRAMQQFSTPRPMRMLRQLPSRLCAVMSIWSHPLEPACWQFLSRSLGASLF